MRIFETLAVRQLVGASPHILFPSEKFSGYISAIERLKSIFALRLAVFSSAMRRQKDHDERRRNSENTAILPRFKTLLQRFRRRNRGDLAAISP